MPPKRKQTPDMPTSPPKRVTRARAKKEVDSKPQTHVKTPSAKAAAKKKVNPPKEESQEVDVQLDDEMKEEPGAAVNTEPVVAEPPKTRGKAKGTSASTASRPKPSVAPAKSTRSRTTGATATADKEVQPPKPKGRAKRNAEPEAPVSSELAVEKKPEPPAKATRSRVASAAVNKPATTRTRAAATAPKKRVKFDDENEEDKENMPIVANSQEKQGPKATGLRAKPIRKPATTRSAAKDKKTTSQVSKVEEHATKSDMLPLSPKKITQVAKTPSSASEDELAGEKTPLRPLSASPSKIPTAVKPEQEISVSAMEVEQIDVPQSPTKHTASASLAASPRKPPPSPYKDALKASPRKVDLGSRTSPPKFDAPASPTKSPLKESPKRVNLGDSMVKPKLQWSKTPVKTSLFQSPARRPGSSMKTSSMFPSSKATVVPVVDAATASKQVSTFKLPALAAESVASSRLRAAKTPTFKVHDSKKDETQSQGSIPSPCPLPESEADVIDQTGEPEINDGESRPDDLVQMVDEVATPDSLQVKPQQAGLDFAGGNDMMCDATETIQEDLDAGSDVDQQQAGGMMTNGVNVPATTASPTLFSKPAFVLASPMIAGRVDDSESEDELASPQKSAGPSPLKNFGVSAKDFGAVGVAAAQQENAPKTQSQRASLRVAKRNSIAFTPLATQMSSWFASSPEKQARPQRGHKRGIFSPAPPTFPKETVQYPAALTGGSPAKVSFFDDEMVVRSAQDAAMVLDEGSTDELEGPSGTDPVAMQVSQESHEDEDYGDENAAPEQADFYLMQQSQDQTLTCTPARVFDQQAREVHTVSKVPLRPAADDDTPLKVPRKRSRSLAGPLSDISMSDRLSIGRDSILSPILQDTNLSMDMLPGDLAAPATPETPTGGPKSVATTPGRSIRKAGFSNVLKGAVVHVDVHTTEGADASGIFVDLLTQMGARCVKQWHWNPQANMTGESSPDSNTPGSKVGITHVVYKDGGKRTLEKVREAKGAVLCVGVGWVLDCERQDKWLDEADYAVDTSIIPRGGSRRRKSMEPRALANLNGNLIPAETPAKTEISPTKEFLTFDTPASRRQTFEIQPRTPEIEVQAPSTPAANQGNGGNVYDSPLSPTTPYYLSKGAQLVQQTCPPKQTQELMFFPVSGNIEDQPNEAVRQRLLVARRKSLQWTSRVQSPLGRTVSYGK